MIREKTNKFKNVLIYSWYNEYQCNWEAWIEGLGSQTSPHCREEAIESIKNKFINK